MTRARRPGRKADDPALVDLLESVREVRTTLAIDLSAAAGALDEDQTAVARDIIGATSGELAQIRTGIQDHRAEVAARRRARRTRALLALPAVPLVGALAMTTAAALSGHSKAAAHHAAAAAPAPVQHTAASTALRRLEHVVKQHARAAQVIGAADDLHKQLTRMIATSTNNPAQLHVVQQLLKLEQHVLEGSKVPGTQLALAASRAIAQLLENRPSHSQPKHSLSSHTTPTKPPTRHSAPSTKPTQTHAQRAPQSRQTPSTTHAAPSPKPTNPLFGDGFFNWP